MSQVVVTPFGSIVNYQPHTAASNLMNSVLLPIAMKGFGQTKPLYGWHNIVYSRYMFGALVLILMYKKRQTFFKFLKERVSEFERRNASFHYTH